MQAVRAAAGHEEDDGLRTIEGLRVRRPAVAHKDGEDTRRLLQQFHQQGTAGEILVFARLGAGGAGDEDDLDQLGVGRLHLDRHAGLVERIFLRSRQGAREPK